MPTYSQFFLAAIGLIAIRWARVENELKLHTSALTAQEGGTPIGDLEIGFKKLRKLWLEIVRDKMPSGQREAERLANKLADLSKARARALHGNWTQAGRGEYQLTVITQRGGLEFAGTSVTVGAIREIADSIADAYAELRAFTGGKHGKEDSDSLLV